MDINVVYSFVCYMSMCKENEFLKTHISFTLYIPKSRTLWEKGHEIGITSPKDAHSTFGKGWFSSTWEDVNGLSARDSCPKIFLEKKRTDNCTMHTRPDRRGIDEILYWKMNSWKDFFNLENHQTIQKTTIQKQVCQQKGQMQMLRFNF